MLSRVSSALVPGLVLVTTTPGRKSAPCVVPTAQDRLSAAVAMTNWAPSVTKRASSMRPNTWSPAGVAVDMSTVKVATLPEANCFSGSVTSRSTAPLLPLTVTVSFVPATWVGRMPNQMSVRLST